MESGTSTLWDGCEQVSAGVGADSSQARVFVRGGQTGGLYVRVQAYVQSLTVGVCTYVYGSVERYFGQEGSSKPH